MKKITFNALLNHKAHNYKPMQIEVEKVIPLYGKRFEQMKNHPLDDCPEIIENRELMYMEGNTAHCILFLDGNGSDGINLKTYYYRLKRLRQAVCNEIEQHDIVPVKPISETEPTSEKIELSVGDVKISLPDDFNEDTLRRLLGVLR